MTISAQISHDAVNNNSNGMISITNTSTGGKLTIETAEIETKGAGKQLIDGENNILAAILIDNESNNYGLALNSDISARLGDIIIKNKTDKLTIGGNITDKKGGISITNSGLNGAEISGTILDKEGNIKISSIGLNTTEASEITAQKGDIEIVLRRDTAYSGEMNLLGIITDYDGTIVIKSFGDAVVGGLISGEKGYIGISNMGGEMSVSADVNLNYLNTDGDGYISIRSTSDAEKLDITGNIVNWGAGHTSTLGTTGISIVNSAEECEGINISGDLSSRIGDIEINNKYGKLTTTADATISNTENGAISMTNSGVGGAEINGIINAKEGDISITNAGNGKTLVGAAITNQNGNTSLTSTASKFDENDIVAMEISGTVDNTNGGVTVSNSNGWLRVVGDVTNKGGDINITNNGEYTEITKAITNATYSTSETSTSGSIHIANSNGNLRIMNTAEISNTSNQADDAITIANAGNILNIEGTVQSLYKGDVEITNTGNGAATIAGQVYAKEGDIDISNSSVSGKLTVSGTITDDKGGVTVTNSSANGTEISGTVLDKEGNISINNTAGVLTLTATGSITDNKGGVSISNTSTTAGTVISGTILDKEGNITLTNTSDSLNISGSITDEKGAVNITNGGVNGTEISGTVLDKEGNIAINNTAGALTLTATGSITDNKGGISISNTSTTDGTVIAGTILDKEGNITLTNTSDSLNISGSITDKKGAVNITNGGANGTEISGTVLDEEGNIDIANTNTGDNSGIKITTTGLVSDANGVANITNKGGKGITIEGYIRGDKANVNINNENSNITIGEYTSDNDKYIDVTDGNVVITQTNGNIVNGIVDQSNSIHTNHDLANPNHAYKTLISTTNDLTMNLTDGDIGVYKNNTIAPGVSIDAKTRDFTDSINVNVGGNVVAKALNNAKDDARLINLRAKESGLNIKNVTSDGNILITAADWQQADVRPTPDSETDDTGYFVGYNILSTSDNGEYTLQGQSISVISSDNIGTDLKKVSYVQDTVKAPEATVSFESENDLNITGAATAVGAETRIYQLITKRGSIDFDINSDADIKEITAGKGIKITQKAQNLTIRELGMPDNPPGNEDHFDDILNPHDDLLFAPRDPEEPGQIVVPNYVVLRVLDAMDTEDRADSNLTVYSLTVKGNNGANAEYYPDGSRLADVTIMADNVYANSYRAPNSKVHTKDNPNGVQLSGRTYTNAYIDPTDTEIREAKGINSYGDGTAISIDIIGVDKDFVDSVVDNPQRNGYIVQRSKTKIPTPFRNKNDRTKFYDYDFKADNVYVSVNDYATENRGVSVDTVYADNAYINTRDTNLVVEDGVINNYAEFRNASKLAVVDNDYRRTVNSDMQLFTKKTGSFSMDLSNSTIMKTTAPVVDFNPYHLVNGYSSENSFVNLTFKETSLRQKEKNMYQELNKKTDYYNKSVSLVFNTLGFGILPDTEIYEISRTGAVVDANDLKVGQGVNVKLKFNDVDIDVEAKVKEIHGNKATVEFLNISDEVSNQIMYEYMKKFNSMKNSISSL
ncbi:MAG: hypothetical protein K6E29_07780 [Cyanobacteria bacterium RUI128]|nr:hypothetical protein [Cyanobacteria bacterium RUI128]